MQEFGNLNHFLFNKKYIILQCHDSNKKFILVILNLALLSQYVLYKPIFLSMRVSLDSFSFTYFVISRDIFQI